jgi:hypothetical protein
LVREKCCITGQSTITPCGKIVNIENTTCGKYIVDEIIGSASCSKNGHAVSLSIAILNGEQHT